MNFTRLIPTLSLKDGRVIKTVKFDQYHDVGHPVTMGKVFDSQDVDELILTDITATQENREPDWVNIQAFADECAMPLTVGGGIANLDHIRRSLQVGGDKVTINTEAVRNPEFISASAKTFGSQCIVVSIDAKQYAKGQYEVLVNGGHDQTGLDAVTWAKVCEEKGAGEICITSVDRDGTMEGYDLELVKSISEAVNIPVIANGGAGLLIDLLEVVREGKASAVACSSIFCFTDNKPIKVKSFLQDQGLAVRPI